MYGSGVGDLVSEQNCYFPTYFGNFISFYFLFLIRMCTFACLATTARFGA